VEEFIGTFAEVKGYPMTTRERPLYSVRVRYFYAVVQMILLQTHSRYIARL
jgi:hypothetical protein